MGFLKKLFGGQEKNEEYVDKQGVYFYIRCDNCGTIVRLRADKQYDLENRDGGFTWHKTVVDSKCFRPMPTVIQLNKAYELENADIRGGQYVGEADYQRQQQEIAEQKELARREAENEQSATSDS